MWQYSWNILVLWTGLRRSRWSHWSRFDFQKWFLKISIDDNTGGPEQKLKPQIIANSVKIYKQQQNVLGWGVPSEIGRNRRHFFTYRLRNWKRPILRQPLHMWILAFFETHTQIEEFHSFDRRTWQRSGNATFSTQVCERKRYCIK